VDGKAHRILIATLAVLTAAGGGIAARAQEGSPGLPTQPDSSVLDPLQNARSEGDLFRTLESANHGDANARYELGIMYKSGTWQARVDRERALQWFEEAALAGVPDAMAQVGALYAQGLGGPGDTAQALFWYRKARAAKSTGGTLALAEMTCQGIGIAKDVPGCGDLLEEAVHDLQPSDARYALLHELAVQEIAMGKRYEAGDGVVRDAVQADSWYKRGAVLGDADGVLAQAALAMTLDSAHQGPERAFALLKDLAAKRDAFGPEKQRLSYEQEGALDKALQAVAAVYEKRGGEEAAKAIPVETLLATRGTPDGAVALAERYAQGTRVPRSAANAERLIEAAGDPNGPEMDDPGAYWAVKGMLGEDYLNGLGAAKNVTKALKLYGDAADAGDASSSIALGLLYVEGTIVPFDAHQAESYLKNIGDGGLPRPPKPGGVLAPRAPVFFGPSPDEIAALSPVDKRRFGNAARLLAEHYQAGTGVPKDLFRARMWYSHAADAGDQIAKTRLAQLPMVQPKLEAPELEAGVRSGSYGAAGMAAGAAPTRVASAAAEPQRVVEERYPNIEAPDIVHPSQEFAVLVSLTGEQLSPETRIVSGQQENGKLVIPMPPGMNSIDLEVNLTAPGMEFIGGSNIGQIELTKGQDSTVAQFHLRTSAANPSDKPARLMATFWYNHAFLARVERDIRVAPDVFGGAPAAVPEALPAATGELRPARRALSPAEKSAGFTLEPQMAAPDLTIIESHSDDTLHLTFVTRYASPVEAVLPKAAEMRAYIGTKLAELARHGRGVTIEGEAPSAQQAEDLARGFGADLYDRFTPPEFKQLYWQLRDAGIELRSVQVLSDDPMLPWELMRAARTGGQDRQEFLGLTARVARWQLGTTGLPRPPQALQVRKLVVIAPHYAGSMALDAAQQEADSLRTHEGFENVKGDYNDVRALASNLPDGIVHFAGHGAVRDEDGGPQFAILLEDSELAPATWKALATASRTTHPFYFFNACEVGQARQAVGALDGWAPALLDTGASGYLGALWPVSDQVAGVFAANFYKILLENASAPVAEVVRQTRQRTFDDTHDPTALAYVLYADPFLEVHH
jgi:TPR repeat protein